ncbi:MAG: hypothetical protein AB8B95_06570 [Pseudohongiellaceae bacterium]
MVITRLNKEIQEQNWVSVLVDLLIVIIGLFSGLQADSWWQQYQDSLQEQTYLLELREDFNGNQDLFEGAIEEGERVLSDMVSLLEQAKQAAPTLDPSELDERLSSLQSMPTFIPISRAFDILSGSGDLAILSNRNLKNSLADFYSFAKVIELVQGTHEQQLVHTFQPYLSANTEIARLMISWEEEGVSGLPEPVSNSGISDLTSTRGFRNIVIEKYYSTRDLNDLHKSLQEVNAEILGFLESEIGK